MVIESSLHRKVVSCNTTRQKPSNTCSRCVPTGRNGHGFQADTAPRSRWRIELVLFLAFLRLLSSSATPSFISNVNPLCIGCAHPSVDKGNAGIMGTAIAFDLAQV